MDVYNETAGTVNRKRTTSPRDPQWLVWHGCGRQIRMPFVEGNESPSDAWFQVLEAALLGYRADRLGDAVHITGRPFGFEGGLQ